MYYKYNKNTIILKKKTNKIQINYFDYKNTIRINNCKFLFKHLSMVSLKFYDF